MTRKRTVQNLRRSQFILTYGPGSILEGRNGPRIIPSLSSGLGSKFGRVLKQYEVHDLRMSYILKKIMTPHKDYDIRFFVLPSNSSEHLKDTQGIYRTYIFPVWKICYGKDGNHNPDIPILYDSSKYEYCPICGKDPNTNVRFVCACPDGHLDEVKWNYAVHGNENQCKMDYFYWNAGGSSLSSINIKCPKCGSETNMSEVYQKYFKCTGRLPEKEIPEENYGICFTIPRSYRCNQRMRVIQRQSTSLRIANTLTLLKIPKYDKPISNILQIGEVAALLGGLISAHLDENTSVTVLKGAPNIANETKEIIFNYIKNNGYLELVNLATELYNKDIEVDNILIEEFETLKGDQVCSDNFCKGPSSNYNIKFGEKEFPFKVYPVDKIKTVTAQIGYQRKPYLKKDRDTGKIIESPTVSSGAVRPLDGTCWYPVYEGIGEGIFITSDENPIQYLNLKDIAEEWIEKKPQYTDRWRDNEVKNPVFVWWHTLSHALIRALSFFSGYSSASIRERIYIDPNNNGGIFLYTTSAGEDCSMGGLVESSEKFNLIMEEALKSVSLCSYDPLCSKVRISPDRVNGAACIYCLLVPETSCEHGNMWLDRHLILGD